MLDYLAIKELAKNNGVPYKDLIVLAPQNDPFYIGTMTDVKRAEWFAAVWQRAGFTRAHLRRVHYWCVSQHNLIMPDGCRYENTEAAWRSLCQSAKVARYLGLVEVADVIDAKHPESTSYTVYGAPEPDYYLDVPDAEYPYISIGGLESARFQPYHMEVWCEKSTMNDVLKPLCQNYEAVLATFEGEVSVTACHALVDRVRRAAKPARIFYVSDFDPAGQSMPVATARKVEWMLGKLGVEHDVKLSPVVLTAEQVAQYQLPRTPIKDSERRGGAFEEIHGAGAVELDALEALHPGQLRRILEEAMGPYYSRAAKQAASEHEWRLRQAITNEYREITARYQEEIAALSAMNDELRGIKVSFDTPATFPPTVNEADTWLFDSRRDYTDQLGNYKRFRRGGVAQSADAG